jgi:hypothetical protein
VNDVGQVIFTLGVVVVDFRQHLERACAVQRHHAGTAEIDGELLRVGVPGFDDAVERAVVADDHAPVGMGAARAEAEHDHGGIVRTGPPCQKRLDRRRRDQRVVAVQDQEIVDIRRNRVLRGERRVRGAEAFRLHRRRVRLGHFADVVHIRADDDADIVYAGVPQCRQYVAQHRASGQRMHDLRHRRLHAGAMTCGEDDGGGAATAHDATSLP